MGFKSLWRALRVSNKPGLQTGFDSFVVTPKNYAQYSENSNADPLCDQYGCQWTRDAGVPLGFRDTSNVSSASLGMLYKQIWETAVAVDHMFVGQGFAGGAPCAVFKVAASFGDPAIPWDASPYYLQLFTPNNGVLPGPGAIPDFVIPAPRPNEGLGQAYFDFGVRTPFNGVSGLGGGVCLAFSVTPNVYTNPGGVLGQINVNWARYAYTP